MNTTKEKASSVGSTQGQNRKISSSDYKTQNPEKLLTTHELLDLFKQAISEGIGYAPSFIEPSGVLKRFSDSGKQRDLTGWYVLHLYGNYASGAFGCWRSGIKKTWHSANGSTALSHQDWHAIKLAIQQAKATQQLEHQKARDEALKLWLSADIASSAHSYLLQKRVGAYGIKQLNDVLLIPLCDLDGNLQGLQKIYSEKRLINGSLTNKVFPKGTQKKGHFHLIGNSLTHPKGVYLCEGYATGASLYEAYQLPVLVAFDAGNLLPVARNYKARFPNTSLTVVADNDQKRPENTGLNKALEVLKVLPNTGLVVPEFPEDADINLSDFNDLVNFIAAKQQV